MEEYLAKVSGLEPNTVAMYKKISKMSRGISQILGGRTQKIQAHKTH